MPSGCHIIHPSCYIHPMAVLMQSLKLKIHMPSGNINIVLEIYTYTPSGCLNTAEIEEHVPITLTYIISGNLNTWAINKYTNILSDDI